MSRSRILLFVSGLLLTTHGLQAQPNPSGPATAASASQALQEAQNSAQADLQAALEAYAQLQLQIKEEAIPLNRKLAELNARLREQRREAERARRLRDNRSVDLDSLRNRVEMRAEQLDYVANLVADFGQRFQRDVDLSELAHYSEEIGRFNQAAERLIRDEELAKSLRLTEQVFLLQTAIERFDRLAGGDIYEGEAVVGGSVRTGEFLAVGPVHYFSSSDGEFAGLSLRTNTSTLPPTAFLSPSAAELIRAAIAKGEGELPVDPTLGSALALAAESDTPWEHVRKGGIWMVPILLFALLAALAAIYKAIEIARVKMPRAGALHDILAAVNAGRKEEALRLAEAIPGPSRAMLVDAVKHSDESKELIEEVMYERMLEVQPKLERMLPFIAVTAATAPLLGLLGTVTGMINTFKLITVFGTGDPRQLSSGISEALITTEFGLIVAIPALVVHALLNRRAQAVLARMERMAVAFVNGLARRN